MLARFGPRARPLIRLTLDANRRRRRWRYLAIAASQVFFHTLHLGGWPFVPSAGVAAGLVVLATSRRRIALRFRLLRTPRAAASDLNSIGTSERRRFVGTVEADVSSFPALGTNIPAVFVRTTFRQPDDANHAVETQDLRGVRFRVRLADGSTVHVNPESLSVMGRRRRLTSVPPALCEALGVFTPVVPFLRERLYQQRVCPGDQVELVGRLQVAPSPEGEAAPGRGTPMLRTIVGIDNEDVLIRVLAPAVRD
jgi:hypothetical protein